MQLKPRFKLNPLLAESKTEDLTNHTESKSFMRTALAWKGSVAPRITARVLLAGLYSAFVLLLVEKFPSTSLAITPFEYSGVVLGLLLVARVNAGLERWWEARKIWGSIVNQSRNLALIGHQYSDPNSPHLHTYLRWIALWPFAMRQRLRDRTELKEAKNLVGWQNSAKIEKSQHMPMYIGAQIASFLKKMRAHGLDPFSFQRAERERALLIDAIGACERIKTTPIPFVMAIKTRRFILLFLFLLPFALVDRVEWFTPFIMMLTAYPLFSLDQIGIELQDPFAEHNLSHLPLDTICKNICTQVIAIEDMDLEE